MNSLLRILFCLLISFPSFSQEAKNKADSLSPVKVNGRLLLANVGFAPIPAFSFNTPIAIGYLSVKKNRLRYEPDFALGLNGKPWMNNNWFRYDFVSEKNLILHAGVNPFLFFRNETTSSGEQIIHAQRSLVFELGADINLANKWMMKVTYQNNNGIDQGSLSGNFIDVSSILSDLRITKMIFINIRSQLFYFNFTGPVDGFYTSNTLAIGHQRAPLLIYVQAVLPLWTGFAGTHFKANTGLVYVF